MASNSEIIISERFVLSRVASDWVAKIASCPGRSAGATFLDV